MSATAVPIPPTPPAARFALWGGLAALALMGAGLAWLGTASAAGGECSGNLFHAPGKDTKAPETTASGLRIQTVFPGDGPNPSKADVALINYRGTFKDGKEFDSGQRVPMPVERVVPGFSEGLQLMQRGGSYRICIPSALAYGKQGAGNGAIPPNATLVFDIDLIDFRSMAEIEAAQQMMQQQQQHGGQPAPNAPQR